ncbi:MAG: hypothetical protein LDL41_22535 [Coleofasciculus sp. S288]|nr:hypothetical protein [Coleofasciculus sp. S288]
MPSFLARMHQPEPENKCPDCLSIKLEGIPVQQENSDRFEFWHLSTQTHQIDLHLTIHFNEQWESLKQGRVKFGLKGGELRLKLEHCELPFESRELAGSFALGIQTERQEPEASKKTTGIEGGIRTTTSALDGSKTKTLFNGNPKTDFNKTEAFQVSVCHVTPKVSEENPAWIFEEERGDPVLKGVLRQETLGTLNAIDLPCRVEATFEVSQRDVCLTDAEGLWPPDISRNKRAVLARLIIQRLLAPKFKPYLSRAELHYD